MSLSVAPSRLANFLTTDFPISSYNLVKSRKVMKKNLLQREIFLTAHFPLGENGCRKFKNSNLLSLYGKHFQLKVGTQASNNGVYKMVPHISLIESISVSNEFIFYQIC